MKDLRTLFIRWYFNQFADLDPLHIEMAKVCEDSPWHRERNVAVHTNMVVAEYCSRIAVENGEKPWRVNDLYGALACAFHDVGKPAARTEAYKPERGTYYRYGGHELISARLWENWAVRNWKFLVDEFGVTEQAIHRIGWLIENHLPWALKKAEKRRQLAIGVHHTAHDIEVFFNIIKADTWGRISDDATEKKQTVDAWCEEFAHLSALTLDEYKNRYIDLDSPIMYMPIGVSGSGKSTLFNSETMQCVFDTDGVDGEILHFSMDKFRHEWYDVDDYRKAYAAACEDPDFKNRVNAEFAKMVKTGKTIFADNINVSKKRRAQYIQLARKYGYRVKAILLHVDLQTVIDRQESRLDKSVPADAVKQQYMCLSLPSIGEVDNIIVYSGNLP